ncbi:MAG: hypothetical protein MUF07_14520 [Steroidobacteraceae bacterium]|jgi:hypothetical protein|nr:hypothetical protein [Steroidobacteraceae bacterium]
MNAIAQATPDEGGDAFVAARPRSAALSAGELRSFLELGAAQLESAMKDSDARMASLASAVSHIVERLAELCALVDALPAGGDAGADVAALHARLRAVGAELELDARQAVVALQFYDKLIQRITHVRDGLSIPAEVIEAGPQQRSAAWERLLDEVRSRYSMVEERVLFDFLIRGTGPREMMQALTDLQGASRPGELELF